MPRLYRLVLIPLVFVLAACAPLAPAPVSDPDAPEPARPVALGVGYIPSVQFAPFYVGIDQGFYADHGIDLSLEYGFENDYLSLVGTGARKFMVGSGDQVILGRAQGLPVTYVQRWFSKFPVVVFANADAGITQTSDLQGKSVGIPGQFGASWIALLALLDSAGLTPADLDLQSIGFTQAAAVSEGVVDAAVDYAVNGPVLLGLEGIPTTQITVDDVLPMPANGVVTNEKTIAEEPGLVGDFVAATQEAIAWTLANPDEAFEIALKFVPEAGGDNEAANRAIFDASLPIWTPASGMEPGATSLEEWAAAEAFLRESAITTTEVDPATLFTNEFLPQP